MYIGEIIAELSAIDMQKRPDTLLVMGTSLKVHGIKQLIKAIQGSLIDGGKTILINKTPLGSEWQDFFDSHLICECDYAVTQIWSHMKNRSRPGGMFHFQYHLVELILITK